MWTKFILIYLLGFLFVMDWGFVVNGEMIIGLTTNRSRDNIYMRMPSTRITKDDKLIQTGMENGQRTAIKHPIKTPLPSLSLPSLYSQSYTGGKTANAEATDIPIHLAAGQQLPVITNQGAIGPEIDRKINEWMISNLSHIIMFQVTDPLADKLKYNTSSSLNARGEAYYECSKVFFEKSFAYPMTSDTEDTFYLLLYGEPAASTLIEKHAIKIKGLTKDYINPEDEGPKFTKGKDDFDTMILKLITLELFCNYPFTRGAPFAPGLESFTHEFLYPYLKELYQKTKNKRLKRNIIYYLGTMGKYEPLTDLFEILKTTVDNIERARALYFLTINQYPGLLDYLLESVQTSEDPAFRVAFINSIGMHRDQKAFKSLVEMLGKKEPEYEETLATIKACIRCMDKEDKETLDKFTEIIKRYSGQHFNEKWVVDPPFHKYVNRDQLSFSIPPGVVGMEPPEENIRVTIEIKPIDFSISRKSMLQQICEIGLVCAGSDRNKSNEFTLKLKEIMDELSRKQTARYNEQFSPLLSRGWKRNIREFLCELSPQLTLAQEGINRDFLEAIIPVSAEPAHVTSMALDRYTADYPDPSTSVIEKLIEDSQLPALVRDRVLRLLIAGRIARSEELTRSLEQIVAGYKPDLTYEQKHIIAMSLVYLGINGISINEERLAAMAVNELNIASEQNNRREPRRQAEPSYNVMQYQVRPESQLLRVALDVLGLSQDEKVVNFLIKMSGVRDPSIRRVAARVLGNYSDNDTKKRLIKLLTDNDGWVRVNAYMSLVRSTGKEYRADWYFGRKSAIKKAMREFKSLLTAN